jgi:hypothetical protein
MPIKIIDRKAIINHPPPKALIKQFPKTFKTFPLLFQLTLQSKGVK